MRREPTKNEEALTASRDGASRREEPASSRIIVCLGPGGVGKTTCSAAIALRAALSGRRALVCTLDPARRLATSLGLSDLPRDPHPLPRHHLREAGLDPDLPLHAMRLDVQNAFGRVLRRDVAEAALIDGIESNRLYRQLVGDVEGVQAYAAIAQIVELADSDRWDAVVLDTPPTRHVRQLLEAPRRIIDAVESPVFRWLLAPTLAARSAGFGLIRLTRNRLIRKMAKVVGGAFVHELAELVGLMGMSIDVIRQKADRAADLLSSPQVGYVVVSCPLPGRAREALELARELDDGNMTLRAAVVNRVHPPPPAGWVAPDEETLKESLLRSQQAERLDDERCLSLAKELLGLHRDYQALARSDQRSIAAMREGLPQRAPVLVIPLLERDPSTLDHLRSLSVHLEALWPERWPEQ
jgi:anion-transporting  ArsA/GET3 family ATPase